MGNTCQCIHSVILCREDFKRLTVSVLKERLRRVRVRERRESGGRESRK